MSRTGPQRKLDAKRRATKRKDQVAAPVLPTAELIKRRIEMAGRADISHDYPLDVLMARGIITETQQRAGWMFAGCRWRAFGFPSASVEAIWTAMVSGFPDRDSPAPIEDDEQQARIERARRQYEESLSAMRDSGLARVDIDEVSGAAIFLRMPSWFLRARQGNVRAGDERRARAIRDGLTALVKYFKLEPKMEKAA